MATAFQRGRDGCVHAEFDSNEKALLTVLAEQLVEIVGPEATTAVPTDAFDAIVAGWSTHAHRPDDDPVYER
ncbi:MAG: hypothetical protein RL745_513, partial [Actinomycetota bacterium]